MLSTLFSLGVFLPVGKECNFMLYVLSNVAFGSSFFICRKLS